MCLRLPQIIIPVRPRYEKRERERNGEKAVGKHYSSLFPSLSPSHEQHAVNDRTGIISTAGQTVNGQRTHASEQKYRKHKKITHKNSHFSPPTVRASGWDHTPSRGKEAKKNLLNQTTTTKITRLRFPLN